jgi:hypothetical protein
VRKDKLFFFFNYQGTRSNFGAGASNNQTQTPTLQMLNGDFSGLVDYAVANNSSCVRVIRGRGLFPAAG